MEYYVNGKPKTKETYEKGQLHEQKTEFYNNGNIKTKETYEKG